MRRLLWPLVALLVLAEWGYAQNPKRSVLYLNSYQPGYPWSDDIYAGLKQGFADSGFDVDLQIEHLDSKKFTADDHQLRLKEFFSAKFRKSRFELVVVSDDHAFDFIERFGDELFPGLPVVFCGVNDFDPARIATRPTWVGAAENPDFAAAFGLARSLYPDRRRIVVLGDQSVTGQAIERQLRKAAGRFGGALRFEFLNDLDMEQTLRLVAGLGDDALVYLSPFYKDSLGQTLSVNEVAERLYATSRVPMLSSWEFMLGHGILGGRLHSGQTQGVAAAGLALRFLRGDPPPAGTVIERFEDAWLFDYAVLERFRIPESRLPKGAKLINEPNRFYNVDVGVFWTALAGLLALALTSAFLAAAVVRRKALEEKYRKLFTDTTFGVIRISPVGEVLDLNPAMLRMLGFDESDEAQGVEKAARLFFASDDSPAAGAARLAAGVQAGETRMAHDFKRLDGGEVRAEITVSLSGGAGGGKPVLEGFVEDVSPREAALRALKESQSMLAGVLDNIPQLVFWKDAKSRYLGANRAFLVFFGIESHTELAGKTDAAFMPREEYAVRAIEWDRKVMLENRTERRTVSYELAPGRIVELDIVKTPLLDHNGRPFGLLGSAEDVTEQRSLERKLMQSQKMEAIGALAGGVAHDFNNILAAIINSTELALLDLGDESIAAKDLSRVLKAGERGKRLIKQILSFTRPTGEGFRNIDLRDVLVEAFGLVRASMPGAIRTELALPDQPVRLLGDPTRLLQVVMNLCTNAYQAMRDFGGSLTVALVVRTDADGSPEAVIETVDDGPGVPTEFMDRIFDPFFTTKELGEGTGLGLAVVQGVVKAHGGTIDVKSEPFVRTAFTIVLPLTPAAMEADPAPEAVIRGGSERILVVEDDPDQVATAAALLRTLGYTAHTAQSGAAALDLLSATALDLVVSDFDMPEMDGLALALRIRERGGPPVLLVTGRFDAARAAGLVGLRENEPGTASHNLPPVLHKPFNRASLAKAVREVLDASTVRG